MNNERKYHIDVNSGDITEDPRLGKIFSSC